MNFETLDYLKRGTPTQRRAFAALAEYAVFSILKDFSPVLAGTIPINIDIEGSDLDIICHCTKRIAFTACLLQNFSTFKGFTLRDGVVGRYHTTVANFRINEFEVEIFGQNRPVREQEAYQHMLIEHAVLQARGEEFRQRIIALKKQGIKTEPAFAEALGLEGDPYVALLNYGVNAAK
ncbi:DUF4269 domain-containing protein [Chryseolinea lacunae]|uniref:DUF4269 domain-containing protein n=1 Tax=Chryseolinea lacunae TaxID=2801331 RepID=A0ABS1KVH0_9BACT|nr:DUF4269 domain-containing protein [Chryseolinea lacunae]MBL0743445.1 DUF4269 domain-containing protein [Chryseolinea lacunae]